MTVVPRASCASSHPPGTGALLCRQPHPTYWGGCCHFPQFRRDKEAPEDPVPPRSQGRAVPWGWGCALRLGLQTPLPEARALCLPRVTPARHKGLNCRNSVYKSLDTHFHSAMGIIHVNFYPFWEYLSFKCLENFYEDSVPANMPSHHWPSE